MTTGIPGVANPKLPKLSVPARAGGFELDLAPTNFKLGGVATATNHLEFRPGVAELQGGLTKGRWTP